MKKYILSILIFSFGIYDTFAQQRHCGSDEKLNEVIQKTPAVLQIINRQNQAIAKIKNTDKAAGIITIPVVVHIIYKSAIENISDAQVYSQMTVLNQDYRRSNLDSIFTPSSFSKADTKIEFCLASVDPQGNTTNGITRTHTNVDEIGSTSKYYRTNLGGYDIWDRDNYLNIWVCEIDSLYLGFAYPPNTVPAAYDGIVIDYRNFGTIGTASQPPYNKGRTTTHEIGHWLNLLHLWGSGNGGCNSTDYVNDTPTQFGPNYGCPTNPSTSCNNNGDMFMDYMDYVDDNCMNAFTRGQRDRMRSTINLLRSDLLTSNGCGAVGIAENQLKRQFDIYPTLSKHQIHINSPYLSHFQYKIFSTRGELIKTTICNQNDNILDISSLNSGLYFLKIQSKGNWFISKIIKQK